MNRIPELYELRTMVEEGLEKVSNKITIIGVSNFLFPYNMPPRISERLRITREITTNMSTLLKHINSRYREAPADIDRQSREYLIIKTGYEDLLRQIALVLENLEIVEQSLIV